MGYTHYWEVPEGEHDQTKWDEFVADCKKLYKNMPEHSTSAGNYHEKDPLALNGCYNYKNPAFNKARVCFNGSDGSKREQKEREKNGKKYKYWEDKTSHGLDHETFVLNRKVKQPDYQKNMGKSASFGFCKTARKPYDLMVTACLVLYKHHFPEVQISSDGNFEDWSAAFMFIAQALPNGKEVGLETLITVDPYAKGALFERPYDE